MENFILFVSSFLILVYTTLSAKDTITPGLVMRDDQTLISADGSFELGFFSPGNSGRQYLGIWYKKISMKTIVWVANRDSPIRKQPGVLDVNDQGNLLLRDSNDVIVWSSNTSGTPQNPFVQLLDSGNLVVKHSNGKKLEELLWQSFDYPCDTLLPGMKLGVDLATGLNRHLSTWKRSDDPGNGDFSLWIDPSGFPQLVVMTGTKIQFRLGPWNGIRYTGSPQLKQNPFFSFEFVINEHEVYYRYMLRNNSVFSRLVLNNQTGVIERFVWVEAKQIWVHFISSPTADYCDNYAFCGANGICNIDNSPECVCLEGFVPKSLENWTLFNRASGCRRRTPLDCQNTDGFRKFSGVKLPDTSGSWFSTSLSLKECQEMCLKNCSCTAYTNSDIRNGGSGCLLWFGELMDVRQFIDGGQDMNVRIAASELETMTHSSKKTKIGVIISSLVLVIGVLIVGLLWNLRKKKPKLPEVVKNDDRKDYGVDIEKNEMELPIYDFGTIATATDNFSVTNKLGQGGFGPVYKGTLADGLEIAVKRLCESSSQGLTEFKNEVILISKLQHRNLVKLVGCCIQGEEKMLIYEYLSNRSLDAYIFNEKRSKLLDWHKRFQIIGGIARGILYLHQDSRLRIIHRDLKAGNVLLDNDMNPKISDFGVAKTFGGDHGEENTTRVVGTHGYMPPEYAVDGLFSIKSDVFSFGVLVLEIISGKRNRGFYHQHHHLNLLGHAWRLWMENRSLELVDKSLHYDASVLSEVCRCIHVGLLCVQQQPKERPNMSSVVLMLNSESSLPQPNQPGFYTERNPLGADPSLTMTAKCSVCEMTTTLLDPR